MYTDTHTHTHANMHTHTHICIHTHTQTCIHTRTHTHVHTYIHRSAKPTTPYRRPTCMRPSSVGILSGSGRQHRIRSSGSWWVLATLINNNKHYLSSA